jgi:large subunit ribosomal protein L6
VTEGFSKILEIEGVGYRAALEGKDLVLYLGYALPVKMPIAEGVSVAVEKNLVKISGIDKELVGRVAAEIRAHKKPEPYKGKGIHYQGEVIRRKAGKKAGTAAA